jgi:hypothetical protein
MLSASDDLMRLPASRDGDGGVSQVLHIDHLGASWPYVIAPSSDFHSFGKRLLLTPVPTSWGCFCAAP